MCETSALVWRRDGSSARARVVHHRPDGSPILAVNGSELIHRLHRGTSYFRLHVPCAVCGHGRVTWRGWRIISAADLAVAEPGEVLCDACILDRYMEDTEGGSAPDEFSFDQLFGGDELA